MGVEGRPGAFVEVELAIEGDQLDCCLESCNRAVDADAALVPLVVDVLEEHAQLLVDESVAARVEVYLLQPTLPLGQIATALLQQLLIVIIVPSS